MQLPDVEVAGRVAFNVAQNLTRKAQEQLEEAQLNGEQALSSVMGHEEVPEHQDSSESSDGEPDEHGGSPKGSSPCLCMMSCRHDR